MLNTQKLLYILPDLAYVAELLPAKKEYTFAIQAFKQINGEFINSNELLPKSIEKLFPKLEEEEYHLILPDFLFTNTIVNVKETSKTAVLEQVEKELLPNLKLDKENYEIQTTVLTSFKGNSKVQISAIEKSVLAPLRAMVKKSKVKISAVSPLSWTLKAMVSLEPSITVIQMGANLYVAQHYIGLDQAGHFPLDKYDAIVETIKTLKGAEPSIQSVYLASSALVEEDIKEKLSDTLPIQQLASFKEDNSKMPSYVKFIIESSMRTLSIADFPVPKFELGKASEADLKSLELEPSEVKETEPKTETTLPKPKVEVSSNSSSKTIEKPASIDLPTPLTAPVVESDRLEDEKKEAMTQATQETTKEEELPSIPEIKTEPTKATPVEESSTSTGDNKEKVSAEEPDIKPIEKKEETTQVATKEDDDGSDLDVDLSQFANKESDDDKDDELTTETKEDSKPEVPATKKLDKPEKKVIKNSSGVNNMLKMVFITVAVFFITIAIGVGVGFGLIKMSDKQTQETTPVVVSQTPTPTPTPSPTPVEIVKDDLSILVVNATTKAGYAGKVKKLLVDADIKDVTAANAKGEYDDTSDYILMKKENKELQALLEKSTDLTLEFSDKIDVEDTADKYDAVIVLAQ